MNDDTLIELGDVSEETKGVCLGGFESVEIPDHQVKTGNPPECP